MGELQANALGFTPVTPLFIETICLYNRRAESAKGITIVSRKLESLLLGRLYILADRGMDDFEHAVWLSKSMRVITNARIMLEEIERRLREGDGDPDELLLLAYRIFAQAEEESSA